MNKIIDVLMKRDGITEEQAREMYDNCYAELMDAIDGTSCLTPEEALMGELGLEMDYILDFLW